MVTIRDRKSAQIRKENCNDRRAISKILPRFSLIWAVDKTSACCRLTTTMWWLAGNTQKFQGLLSFVKSCTNFDLRLRDLYSFWPYITGFSVVGICWALNTPTVRKTTWCNTPVYARSLWKSHRLDFEIKYVPVKKVCTRQEKVCTRSLNKGIFTETKCFVFSVSPC